MKGENKQHKKNRLIEASLWIAALTFVIIGIASSCMMVSLAFFFIARSIA